MMKNTTEKPTRKTQAVYPYFGLGFEVRLINVNLIQIENEWVPDLDFNLLEEHMSYAVPFKPDKLAGNEVRFLRRHLGLTLDDLAAKLGVTRQGVIKWEKTGDRPTNMNLATEKLFRMITLEAKGVPADLFKKAFDYLFSERKPLTNLYEVDASKPINNRKFMQNLLSAC